MHGKPKSHLLLRLLTPELHPVTDAAAHVVSGAGEICWSRRKCSVATQGVFFFYDLLFPQILDFEILIDLDNFLDINHLIWYGFCCFLFCIFMGFDWILEWQVQTPKK